MSDDLGTSNHLGIVRIWRKIDREGLGTILKRRLRWYWSMIRINNWFVGRMVEILGNRVRMEGLVFSVDSPSIETSHKSILVFGLHELDERSLLRRHLPRNLPIVECGGGLGVISCLANRRIDRPDRHVVVEANPNLIPLIERNRTLNGCQFMVVNKAIAYDSPIIKFNVNSNFVGSSIGVVSDEMVSVLAASMKETADAAGFDHFSLICDIEGAEAALVDREIDVLRERVPFILLEVHPGVIGSDAVDEMIFKLESVGFVVLDRFGDNMILTRG
jgi:FkbM family methyltransferase